MNFIFESKLPLYHVDRVIRETRTVVDNGFREIYVNAAVYDGSDVARLMKVFSQRNAYDDKFPCTSELKHHYVETKEEQQVMCDNVELFCR